MALLPLAAVAQDTVYFCDFDHPDDIVDWVFVNDTEPNYWVMGTATNMSSGGLYVTNCGDTNAYDVFVPSVAYVYREVTLPRGVYRVRYNWRCMGFPGGDVLRLFLAPDTAQFVAGTPPAGNTYPSQLLPAGFIQLDGGYGHYFSPSWSAYEDDFIISTGGVYKLVLLWWNTRPGLGQQPPAAVDNLLIERQLCTSPLWLYADSVSTTSFVLHWSDLSGGNTTQWYLMLCSGTQTYEWGMLYRAYDTLFAFTGLVPNTEYRVYVSAVCGSGANDTTDPVSLQVRTRCGMITSLPFVENFETGMNDGLPFCWRRLPGMNNIEVERHRLEWNANRPPYRYLLLPGIDATVIPIDSIQLSMRGMSHGDGVCFEVGVMTDPADTASFVPVGRVNVLSWEWERYVVDFSDYDASVSDVLYIAMRPVYAPFGYQNGYTYFDDFVLDYAACQRVCHLTACHVGTTGARIDWMQSYGNLPDPDGYEVRVEPIGPTSATLSAPPDSCRRIDTMEPHCLLTGLEPNTTYRVWVRVHCTDDSSVWDTVRLTTLRLPCLVVDTALSDTVSLGSGTSQSTGVPVSYLYAHSLCQSIYTASELLAAGLSAGPIEGMDYTFTNNHHDMMFSIYVGTTDSVGYSGPEYIHAVPEQDLAYGPALHAAGTSGTVHYTFGTPFVWDGESNLIVTTIMNDATSNPEASLFYGYSTLTGVDCTLHGYKMNSQLFTTDNMMSGSYSMSQYRPSVVFYTMVCSMEADCVSPTIGVERVESDGAYIEWTSGNQESSWDVLYRLLTDTASVATDSGWVVADTNVNTNHYHLVNLEPASDYEVRVVPRCDSAQNDGIFAQASFTTSIYCAPIGVLPWTTSFEDFEVPSEIRQYSSCWYGGGEHYGSSYPQIVSTHAHSGSQSLNLYYQAVSGQCHIATPPISVGVNQLQAHFYAYADPDQRDYHYQLVVGVMDDPEDITTFQPVATVTPSEPEVWEENEVPFDSYTGEGRYIALASLHNGVHVDDLTVEYIPSCQRPRNVTASAVTRHTAVVQWDGRHARNYEVEYGPAGFEPGTGSVVATVSDSVTLTGLTHSTVYDLYVRAICDPLPGEVSNDTSVRSFVTTFTTGCDEIDTLPYVQNFSHQGVGEGAIPLCWVCYGYPRSPYIVRRGDDRGLFYGYSLYMHRFYERAYAILPAVDTSRYPISSLQVLVQASSTVSSASHMHLLSVGVCQDDGDILSFTPVDTIDLTHEPTVYEVSLSNATGSGRCIAFSSISYSDKIFIDSVVVQPIPSCQVPYGLSAAGLSPTTATLGWQSRDTVSQWQVEYMLHGMPLGMGTRMTANTPSPTLTGLLPNTFYDFYVRSICSPGDTSHWSYAPGCFVTQQIPATVPYHYGCDSASEWDSWQTLANGTSSWYRGMADGRPAPSIYLSSDSGSTCNLDGNDELNAVAYRDIDFGNVDTSFLLSFSASASSYRDPGSPGGLSVFLVDPATPMTTIYGGPGRSPWGYVDTIETLADIPSTSAWTDFVVTLDSIHGVHRLVFFGHGITASSTRSAVDNISIQYPPCQRPYSIHAIGITATSATLLWHGSQAADYHVRLYNTDETLLADDTVHTNSIQYLTLLPSTTYKVRVGRLCDGTETLQPNIYTFSTPTCMDGHADTIGNLAATTSVTDIPFNLIHPYSYTQQILLASELQGRGEITAINFLYDSPYSMSVKTNCTIYLGHTRRNEFMFASDVVPPTDLQAVYIGPLNCSQGWNRILLGSPFAYDGTSNLVVAIDDNSGNSHFSNRHFAANVTDYPMTASYYGSNNVDCSSANALIHYVGGKSVHSYRSVISLEMCPSNSCQPPRLFPPRVRANDVTVRWSRNGQAENPRFLFGYRRLESDSWIMDNVPLTDTFFRIDHFVFNANYVYHVRQYCDLEPGQEADTSVSNWAMGSFNTGEIPCLPPLDLRVVQQTNTQVWFTWTPDDNNISYRLHVWGGGGYDTVVTTYLAHGMVEELNPASRYYAAVEVRCEYLDEPSIWSDTITFETAACPNATDLVALEVHGNSVLLDWQCDESVGTWLVEWGLQGFDQGTGTTVTADHHPFLLTGLTGETTYDIDVRSVCDDGYVSESWSGRLTVTTAYSGIDGATDDLRVRLTPNPTSGDMMLALPASIGAVRVEVIDMAGRIRQTYALPPHTEQATLATSQLPQGAYYMRVTGDNMSVVKKILKIES